MSSIAKLMAISDDKMDGNWPMQRFQRTVAANYLADWFLSRTQEKDT